MAMRQLLSRCLRRNLSPTASITRHASSSSNASLETSSPTQKQAPTDTDYVTIQEMKGLIEQYDKGDMDAIPSIFEAILKRKLVQKKNNIESDPDLDQLLKARRLEFGSDFPMDDENTLDDDHIDEDETDLDSDWTSDDDDKK